MCPSAEAPDAFTRALASNVRATRDGALAGLGRWLAARGDVPDADLLKVWKGMFYALWHADKPAVQARARMQGEVRTGRRRGRAAPPPAGAHSPVPPRRRRWLRRWPP